MESLLNEQGFFKLLFHTCLGRPFSLFGIFSIFVCLLHAPFIAFYICTVHTTVA